ncbi:hypothetical protein [Tenacibaculum agarivorans]|uniref:hypothetical protein n=1 Tax=Tenacibaculum agarivorans TaxID=1908389 RepID=UPI00094B9E81|nr:hypothetical protein [Tenacibaculum agarivorans]
MKKNRLKLEKFTISKLKMSKLYGGTGDNGGGGGTQTNDAPKGCLMGSIIETEDEDEDGN